MKHSVICNENLAASDAIDCGDIDITTTLCSAFSMEFSSRIL